VQRDRVTTFPFGAEGDSWTVNERDFRNARRLESEFAARGVEFVDGP
jgi:hypothetical protein